MAQIQEGLRILQEEAPDVFSSMTNISGGAFAAATTDPAATTTQSTEHTASEGTEGAATTTPAPANTSSLGNVELASLMASLLNVAPSGQDSVRQLISLLSVAPLLTSLLVYLCCRFSSIPMPTAHLKQLENLPKKE